MYLLICVFLHLKKLDTEKANCAAGHELRGLDFFLSAVNDCHIADLHVPMGATVDYRGFRLLAVALLPLHSNSLVIGSDDGGVTVHDDRCVTGGTVTYISIQQSTSIYFYPFD